MKKYKIFSVIVALGLFFGACEDTNENFVDQRGVAVSPKIESIASSFFELSDLDNAYVEFVVGAEFPAEVSEITVLVSFGDKETFLPVYTTVPATVKLTCGEVADALGVNLNDLALGDVFSFQILVSNLDGLRTYSNVVLNATVACASSLEGIYTCVANGSSTDPGPAADVNPAVNYTTTITLTGSDVNGEYAISDFSGGLFPLWYSVYGLTGDQPGKLKDVCGDLSYINTKGPYGSPISGTGNVDELTGVITLDGLADSWGDAWNLVLTPQ
ncbi:MAG: hypothetical protein ACERIH_06335 [Labilibaculum antarcticum]